MFAAGGLWKCIFSWVSLFLTHMKVFFQKIRFLKIFVQYEKCGTNGFPRKLMLLTSKDIFLQFAGASRANCHPPSSIKNGSEIIQSGSGFSMRCLSVLSTFHWNSSTFRKNSQSKSVALSFYNAVVTFLRKTFRGNPIISCSKSGFEWKRTTHRTRNRFLQIFTLDT